VSSKWSLPFGFPRQKILYAVLISSMRTTYFAHLVFLYLFTLITISEWYTSRSSSLCSYLQPLDPIFLLSTSFWNILNLCYYIIVKNHVSFPYKTTHKIRCFNILTDNDNGYVLKQLELLSLHSVQLVMSWVIHLTRIHNL
jgi:hypothetical protein